MAPNSGQFHKNHLLLATAQILRRFDVGFYQALELYELALNNFFRFITSRFRIRL